jgi:hypothetical protein
MIMIITSISVHLNGEAPEVEVGQLSSGTLVLDLTEDLKLFIDDNAEGRAYLGRLESAVRRARRILKAPRES